MPLGAREPSATQRRSSSVGSSTSRRSVPPPANPRMTMKFPDDSTKSVPPSPDTRPEATTAIERVCIDDVEAALIIRAGRFPDATHFLTPPDWSLQTGFVVYPAGGEVAAHRHKPIDRRIRDTGEVLVVRRGRCAVDFYDERGARVDTRELASGDVLILRTGGHGLRMFEDTVLLEIKQGPYAGPEEKEYL